MKLKTVWLMFPITILPCMLLFTIASVIFSVDVPFFSRLDATVGIEVMLLSFVVSIFLSVGMGFICFLICIVKKYDSLSVAKTVMIIKLIQLPMHIVMFLLGVLFFITIFTIAFAFVIAFVGACVLFVTGLMVLAAVVNASQSGEMSIDKSEWILACQCVFGFDVIAVIVFYIRLKRARARLYDNKPDGNNPAKLQEAAAE